MPPGRIPIWLKGSIYKAWFPEGETNPEITVLCIDVAEGDHWEANGSKLVLGICYVR